MPSDNQMCELRDVHFDQPLHCITDQNLNILCKTRKTYIIYYVCKYTIDVKSLNLQYKLHQQITFEDCPTDPVWTQIGLLCYIVLLDSDNGVSYGEAKDMCSNINGTVIMPKTEIDANTIKTELDFA